MKYDKNQEAALLAAVRTEYRRLDDALGLRVADIPLSFSSRLTRKLGYFQVKKTGLLEKPQRSIVFSYDIAKNPDLFLDVIRHEYAHAALHLMDPRHQHGHDSAWKALCLRIGCKPEATVKDLPYEPQHRVLRYQVICQGCGQISGYTRASKLVQIAQGKKRGKIICKKCGASVFQVKNLQI